jgi:hypothetical protein
MSILVRTTLGNFSMDSFIERPVTAEQVLNEAKVMHPHGDFVSVRSMHGTAMQPDDVVLDGTTVYVECPQPVDG